MKSSRWRSRVSIFCALAAASLLCRLFVVLHTDLDNGIDSYYLRLLPALNTECRGISQCAPGGPLVQLASDHELLGVNLFRWHASLGVWCFLGAAGAALATHNRMPQNNPRWVETHRAVLILSLLVTVLSFSVRTSTCEVFDRSARSVGLSGRSLTLASPRCYELEAGPSPEFTPWHELGVGRRAYVVTVDEVWTVAGFVFLAALALPGFGRRRKSERL